MTDQQDLRARLPELPEPWGFARVVDGQLFVSVGATKPHDRSGGYATPWAAMFGADQMRAYALEAAAQLGRVGDVDYVTGALDASSPPRVWLQIDTDGDNDIRDERWPGSEHVTWHDESIGGLEIQYVRADLVSPQLGRVDENAVGCLTISRWKGVDSMVNHDFDYYGSLPDGSYSLYTRPQLPAGVPDGFYLKLLVAAGHITQEVADKTRDIAVSVLAAAPQPDNKDTQP